MAIPYNYIRGTNKVGNSLMISLPSIWVKAHQIKDKEKLVVEVYEDRVVIRKKESGRSKS